MIELVNAISPEMNKWPSGERLKTKTRPILKSMPKFSTIQEVKKTQKQNTSFMNNGMRSRSN